MANPISPNNTGTMMMRSCMETAPEYWAQRRLPRSRADHEKRWSASRVRRGLLLWFLVSTGSNKFRFLAVLLLLRGLRLGSRVLEGLFLGCALQEGLHVRGKLRRIAWRKRLGDVRRDHHQQFSRRLLRLPALEKTTEDGNVTEPGHFHDILKNLVIE